MTNISGEVDTV